MMLVSDNVCTFLSYISITTWKGEYYCLHCTDEETETQGDWTTWEAERGLKQKAASGAHVVLTAPSLASAHCCPHHAGHSEISTRQSINST